MSVSSHSYTATVAVDGSVNYQALSQHSHVRRWEVIDWKADETYCLRRSKKNTWKQVDSVAQATEGAPCFIQKRGWWSTELRAVSFASTRSPQAIRELLQ